MRRGWILAAALLALAACGGRGGEPSLPEQGASLAQEKGCVACHSADGSASVGPTWKGLHGSQVELPDGTTVVADGAYLRESILQPGAKTVKGYTAGLMETVIKPNSLTDAEVRALVEYIKSRR